MIGSDSIAFTHGSKLAAYLVGRLSQRRVGGPRRDPVSAPTVLVLDRIATALGTSIARLLDEPAADWVVLLRRDEQRVVSDPSGWRRRILSPVLPGVEFEFMRTTIESWPPAT